MKAIRGSPKVFAELSLLLKKIKVLEGGTATQIGMKLVLQLVKVMILVFFLQ